MHDAAYLCTLGRIAQEKDLEQFLELKPARRMLILLSAFHTVTCIFDDFIEPFKIIQKP